jgi:hypothetical protein
MTSALEASKASKKFFVFPPLLDGLAPTFAIFRLKMQKSRKSAHPNEQNYSLLHQSKSDI